LPTQRAFLMIGLVFLAVLFDRNPISMNLVAWAAMAILLIAPESVGNVSFQMSFAAVVALVAAYESVTARRITRGLGPGLARRGSAYVGGVILTTVIAGTATAPFALFHFNQTALYGVLANALAVPLTAFWVMPAGILSLLLMSVGMEELALGVMGGGIGMVVAVARWVSSLPGAVLHLAAIPVWPLAVVVLGGLWLAIWKSGWRFLGIVPIILGAVLAVTAIDPPDILVSETGKKIALRASTGELVFIGSPKGFVGESWARRNGQSLDILLTIKNKKIAQLIDIECDRLGCFYKNPKGLTVAIIRDHAALSEDCRVADVVISAIPARRRDCSTPSRIIDRFALWRYGPHEIRFREGEARTRSVYDVIGDRPWNRLPGPRR